MEILIISHKYPPSIGGMQTHCYKLVQELEKQHKIHDLIWKSNYPRIIFFLSVVFRALIKLKQNPDIQIIYVNDGLMSLVCTPLLWFTKKPIVATIHGLDINFPSRFYQKWAKKYLNQFSQIIAVSEPTRNLCISKGILPEKVALVENAVDITFSEEEEDPGFRQKFGEEIGADLSNKFLLVSLGRGIPRKGFNWFAKNVVPKLPDNVVYLVLARKNPQETLFNWIEKLTSKSLFEKIRLLVGAEVDGKALQKTILDLKLQDKVYLLSQFSDSRSKIFQIIKHSDLFIMPNIEIPGDYEGFGLVALEAASQGTLTLAANVDGIPSAVKHEENGLLINPGDTQHWVDNILHLISNESVLNTKAEQFKKNTLTKGRSWESMASNYLEVFKKVSI
ncbi:MAG: hypothetical protein CMP48_15050 [Rickettsiales bacterium]|nr:hypothetical protein [Rickettsiales bacterium]